MKGSLTDITLPLFWDGTAVEGESHFGFAKLKWSYSRRTVFEQCPRRYYYEYYGARKLTANTDPDKKILSFLKSLENRHERAGTIAHLVISTYFRKAHSGELWAEDRLCRWAQNMFRNDCNYSQADPEGVTRRTEKFPPVLLHEYYYRFSDVSSLCCHTEKKLVDGIYAFATNPGFAEFRLAGAMPDSLVEHHFTISGLPCHGEGKLDLVFIDRGRRLVVDWKLGSPSNGGNDSLQLAAYALWASQYFDVEPEELNVCTAHLSTGDIVYFPINHRILTNARARIVQDTERMAALHNYGLRGVKEAFTPCEQNEVCKLCAFQKVCPEGSAVIHA